MGSTGIIILAAGNSSRFGSIKQLLHHNGKTLIENIIEQSLIAGLNPVIVVTGAYADEVSKKIKQKEIEIVYNKKWQQGMASGIFAGINKILLLNDTIEDVIIAVCDQPFVSSGLFKQIIEKRKETGKNIIACSYADTIGTPVLFTQKYFNKLLQLSGEEGAKKFLNIYQNDVATIDFPQGSIDIDTREDFEKLKGIMSS